MFVLIKRDLKQNIKKPLTWFLILILCMMSMINIIEIRDQRKNRPFKGHDAFSLSTIGAFKWSEMFDDREKELFPKAYYSESIKEKTEEQIIIANEANDTREVVRLMAFNSLLWLKHDILESDTNTVFEKEIKEMWKDVSGDIKYEDIDFNSSIKSGNYEREWSLLIAKYYHNLYKLDMDPIYSDDINNITYLYDYFFNIVPKLIGVISIILIYNTINKEKNSGSLRLIITQSVSRWKYYIGKWISGIIHIFFVIISPAAIISSLLGFFYGFAPLKYPTFYIKGTMTTFKPIPNYLDAIKMKFGIYPKLKYSTFSYYAPNSINFPTNTHEKMEIIPIYKYLLIVLLLTILFIAFVVALTQLISAVINKELISFAFTSIIFVIGTLVSIPFKYEKNINLSPFTMDNASRIVSGTYNATALTSIVVLSVSVILLLLIGIKYFRKKEI